MPGTKPNGRETATWQYGCNAIERAPRGCGVFFVATGGDR